MLVWNHVEKKTDLEQKPKQLGFVSVLKVADGICSSTGRMQSSERHGPLASFSRVVTCILKILLFVTQGIREERSWTDH